MEFIYTLKGRLNVHIDGQEHALESGNSMYFDSGRVRGWKCDTAVNTNIGAKAMRSALLLESAWGHTPTNPIDRPTNQGASITISGATEVLSTRQRCCCP